MPDHMGNLLQNQDDTNGRQQALITLEGKTPR